MEFLWKTDWGRLFTPEMSLPEILLRGTLVYLAICLLLRVVLKRQAGKVAMSDLLVVSIVAGVCRNPLVRDAYSVTDGVMIVGVILLWSFVLDWLSFHSPLIHRCLHRQPVQLIQDGRVLHEQLRCELMTESQLQSKLRCEGAKGPTDVAEAWMEGDGRVSVVKKPGSQTGEGGTPQIDLEGNGVAGPSHHAPASAEVAAFLAAARALEERAARHRQVIAEEQRGIDEIQQLLARFGFRLEHAPKGRRGSKGTVVTHDLVSGGPASNGAASHSQQA